MGDLSPRREGKIGSSMIAALFGKSPYLTRLQLYAHFVEGLPIEPGETERMRWGRRLQTAILEETAAEMRWEIRENVGDDWTDGEPAALRFGATIDGEILNADRGPGICETKNVDAWIYKTTWDEHAAPENIELQLQHQLLCRPDCTFGAISPLVGGNGLGKILIREPNPKVQDRIRQELEKFWISVEKKEPPKAQGRPAEIPALEVVYGEIPETVKECFGDAALRDLVHDLAQAKYATAYARDLEKNARARVIEAAGGAGVLRVNGYSVGLKRIQKILEPGVTEELADAIEWVIYQHYVHELDGETWGGDECKTLARAWFDWQTKARQVSTSIRLDIEPVEGDPEIDDIPLRG